MRAPPPPFPKAMFAKFSPWFAPPFPFNYAHKLSCPPPLSDEMFAKLASEIAHSKFHHSVLSVFLA
jgi:hypothetical protein